MPTSTPGAAAAPATGPSRRQQYSASTKRALVDVAEELFTEHGYAATSLDAIVAGARVTKGALYHHFSGKQALFEAVFDRVEADASATIRADPRGPRRRVGAGHGRAPVLPRGGPATGVPPDRPPGGSRRPRLRAVPRARGALDLRPRPRDRPVRARHRARPRSTRTLVETFGRIFFGGLSSAGESVSSSDDPDAAGERVEDRDRRRSWPGCAPSSRRLLRERHVAVDGRDQLHPRVTGRDLQLPVSWSTASIGLCRSFFDQVPRTSRPSWKSSAAPSPTNFVSGTG